MLKQLVCNFRVTPLAVDTEEVVFSWQYESEPAFSDASKLSEDMQFQVIVVRKEGRAEKLIWESALRPASGLLWTISYSGPSLEAGLTYHWYVCVLSVNSSPVQLEKAESWFVAGYSQEKDWRGQWITAPCCLRETQSPASPYLVKDFFLAAPCVSGRLVICGLGYYKAWIQGKRVSNSELDPAQTDYEQRVMYQVHDVTALLEPGCNRVAVMLGNGWYLQQEVWDGIGTYGVPRLRAFLELEDALGNRGCIETDTTWLTKASPLLHSNIYSGEIFDARLYDPDWLYPDQEGFTAAASGGSGKSVTRVASSAWEPAIEIEAPGGVFTAQTIPAIKKTGSFKPVLIAEPVPGFVVYDFGQNMAGWVELRPAFPEGTELQLRFGEDIGADGRVDTSSTGVFATGVEQIDRYICSGTPGETWEPMFCYHGFRYVEISFSRNAQGLPGSEKLLSQPVLHLVKSSLEVLAHKVHTALQTSGGMTFWHPVLSAVKKLMTSSFESNLHSVLTDCPARERCGWLGDIHAVAETLIYFYDSRLFLEKFLEDIETTRRGGIPWDIAPGKRLCLQGCPDWIVAGVLVPWELYVQYGELRILKKFHHLMVCVVEYMHELSSNGLVSEGRGDWCPPGYMVNVEETPPAFINTAYYARAAELLSKACKLLELEKEEQKYREWSTEAVTALHAQFYTGGSAYGSQCCNAIAINFSLVPDAFFAETAAALAEATCGDNAYEYRVGAFGAKHLFPALSLIGRDDLVYKLLTKEEYPGYMDIIRQGATTLWENWEKIRLDAPVCVKRSLNHHMHGGAGAWFYRYLAGITPLEATPGYKKCTLQPHFIKEVGGITCTYASPFGIIESSWQYHDTLLHWQVRIPGGVSAELIVPKAVCGSITEKGRTLEVASRGDLYVYEAAEGAYYIIIKPEGHPVMETGY